MKKIQKLTIIVGCTGIVLNTIGLITSSLPIGYFALAVARTSAVLYLTALSRFRWFTLIPLTICIINAFFQEPSLVFAENLTQAAMYQIAAYQTFKQLNQ